MNYNKLKKDFSLIEDEEYEFLCGKTIFMAGGTGLIGSYLVGALLRDPSFDVQFILLSRNPSKAKDSYPFFKDKRVSFIKGNIIDPLPPLKADYFIHAASTTNPTQYSAFPVETITTNIIGLKNILEVTRENKESKVLFCSSCEVYGVTNEKPLSELDLGYVDLSNPRSCYNEAKRVCESLCVSSFSEYQTKYVIARLSRVYGPTMRQDDTKALSQFLTRGLHGQDIELKSAGTQVFDYTYVADAVRALLYLLKNEENDVFNVSANNVLSLKQIADLIAKKCGTHVVVSVPKKAEKAGYSKSLVSVLSSKKLIDSGFDYKVDLSDGISRTISIIGRC
jgi:nucleoside-diphosphate-sugar epimerase